MLINYPDDTVITVSYTSRIYGMRNKVQYEAKAEDNGIQQ